MVLPSTIIYIGFLGGSRIKKIPKQLLVAPFANSSSRSNCSSSNSGGHIRNNNTSFFRRRRRRGGGFLPRREYEAGRHPARASAVAENIGLLFPDSDSTGSSVSRFEKDEKFGPRGVPKISLKYMDMDDASLIVLSSLENHEAREEILRRHIIDVHDISYEEAYQIFLKIEQANKEGLFLVTAPYYFGIGVTAFFGLAAIPLVYHLPTIEWFNEWAVTTERPEEKDLETPLEASIWSWMWMEPSFGTWSFILLCSQFIRAQMNRLGVEPYTHWIKHRRGEKLAKLFPMYDPNILIAYSETARFVHFKQHEKMRLHTYNEQLERFKRNVKNKLENNK